MDNDTTKDSKTPSQLIDERIEELGDWRGQMLSRVRNLIKQVVPEVIDTCVVSRRDDMYRRDL